MTNSNSWDHQIVALPYNHNFGGERLRCTAGRKCPETALWKVSYAYITGRKGRQSHAQRDACAIHAVDFGRKHNLEVPAAQVTQLHKWADVEKLGRQMQVCENCHATRIQGEFSWQWKHDEDLSTCPPANRSKVA